MWFSGFQQMILFRSRKLDRQKSSGQHYLTGDGHSHIHVEWNEKKPNKLESLIYVQIIFIYIYMLNSKLLYLNYMSFANFLRT